MGQILRAICPWILSSGTHPNCLESFDKILLSPKTKMQFSGISIGNPILGEVKVIPLGWITSFTYTVWLRISTLSFGSPITLLTNSTSFSFLKAIIDSFFGKDKITSFSIKGKYK